VGVGTAVTSEGPSTLGPGPWDFDLTMLSSETLSRAPAGEPCDATAGV
jgi:hypothetical protein